VSDKSKKFNPSAGFVVAVHMNKLGIRAVADELDVHPELLADAMDKAGFQVVADPSEVPFRPDRESEGDLCRLGRQGASEPVLGDLLSSSEDLRMKVHLDVG
jgi:hypothetical protein